MTEIVGYKLFAAAAGNYGNLIAKYLTLNHANSVIDIHLTNVGYPDYNTDFFILSSAERKFAGFIQNWWMKEGATNMVQSTKLQSLAYGFSDSHVSLAA